MGATGTSKKVDFGAQVPRELYDEFRTYFPGYGATTWFINNALSTFMDSVRNSPDAQTVVQSSIEAMVQENRSLA